MDPDVRLVKALNVLMQNVHETGRDSPVLAWAGRMLLATSPKLVEPTDPELVQIARDNLNRLLPPMVVQIGEPLPTGKLRLSIDVPDEIQPVDPKSENPHWSAESAVVTAYVRYAYAFANDECGRVAVCQSPIDIDAKSGVDPTELTIGAYLEDPIDAKCHYRFFRPNGPAVAARTRCYCSNACRNAANYRRDHPESDRVPRSRLWSQIVERLDSAEERSPRRVGQ